MTTKTGEALRGRKRPKGVLAKAWATRRKNKAAAKRAAAKVSMAAAQAGLNRERAVVVANHLAKLEKAARRGSKTPTPKAKKAARRGPAKPTPRSEPVTDGALNPVGATMASMGAAKQAQSTERDERNLEISARALIVAARKRDAIPGDAEVAVGNMLHSIIQNARHELRRELDIDETARIRAYARETNRKIVCSFIASLEQHAAAANGLPASMVISSYTLCRMVDILNEHGYKADGYRPQRHD